MQSPGRYAASCARADAHSFGCRPCACRTNPKFLGVLGSELQLRPKRSCGLSAYGVWRTKFACLCCSECACLRCSECACLLKPPGNDNASYQHTAAGDSGKR